jgi:dihydroorotate dehydrogenase (fumarate)/dihydroorotate dehydrogenase
MSAYERVLRPLLFALSADRAHALARGALRAPAVWRALGAAARVEDPRLGTELAGIRLANPIGLAPGFDKDAELLPALGQLGFGYLCVGSITREARFGNPFPRLVRYPEREAIANSMGLPNRGIAAATRRLGEAGRVSCPVVASVAGFSAQELLNSARAVEPYVAAVEIGLVCPNTSETERLEELRLFSTLADGLARSMRKPVFVKLPPHRSPQERGRTFALLDECLRTGLAGVSVSGTRPHVEPRLGTGRGSLAGRPVFEDSLRVVAEVADRSGGRLAIKGAGGVFTGADALRMLEAGATSVELYSAFIYRGWEVAGRIKRELLALLRERGTRLSALTARRRAAAAGVV